MSIANGYLTRDELAGYIAAANNQASIPLDNRAGEMDQAIEAASRAIDDWCGRTFYADAGATYVFAADHPYRLDLGGFDLRSVTTLKTDEGGDGTFETTWASSDYQLEPLNQRAGGSVSVPYTQVRAIDARRFPVSRQALVQIVGDFGWAAVPEPVKQACLIHAHALFLRSENPFGIAGVADAFALRTDAFDRQVRHMLAPYRRHAHLVT